MNRTYTLDSGATLFHADCRDALRALPDDSLDSCVTDPPYHLQSITKRFATSPRNERTENPATPYGRTSVGFMGKEWDGGDIAFQPAFWYEVLRVLKPGAYLVAFGASRGYHRMACAIEDAGFEIRDSLMYLYGTGFPKSHQLDRQRGELICGCESEPSSECDVRSVCDADVSPAQCTQEEREEILQSRMSEQGLHAQGAQAAAGRIRAFDRADQSVMEGRSVSSGTEGKLRIDEIHPMPARTDRDGEGGRLCDGTQSGHGAALPLSPDANGVRASHRPQSTQQRPAEPRIVAGQSQPQNGGAWTTCGRCGKPMVTRGLGTSLKPAFEPIVLARKPLSEGTVAANVLRWRTGALNIDACRIGDEGGTRGATAGPSNGILGDGLNGAFGVPVPGLGRWPANVCHDGSDEVVGAFPNAGGQAGGRAKIGGAKGGSIYGKFAENVTANPEPRGDSGSASRFFYSAKASRADRAGSKHPTVKPVALMEWLSTLITPPGGTVLDPFAGSGTTGVAARNKGFKVILCEREDEYVQDIRRRFESPSIVPDTHTHTPQGRRIYGRFADEKYGRAVRSDQSGSNVR